MNESDFLEEEVVFGIIVKGGFKQIREMKQAFTNIDGLDLIYQKYSLNRLRIIDEILPSGSVDNESK